jgi:hypothetical protein
MLTDAEHGLPVDCDPGAGPAARPARSDLNLMILVYGAGSDAAGIAYRLLMILVR